MKSRTLKELGCQPHMVPIGNWKREQVGDNCLITVGDLRKEAIKWIKRLDKEEMSMQFATLFGIKPFQLVILNKSWKAEKKFTIGWIKHFFNITDEEVRSTK